MIVEAVEKSNERCAEAGWHAYDFFLTKPTAGSFINTLGQLGGLMYMPMLKKPFYKVEGEYFFIKGIEGEKTMRVAVHAGHMELIDFVKAFVENGQF